MSGPVLVGTLYGGDPFALGRRVKRIAPLAGETLGDALARSLKSAESGDVIVLTPGIYHGRKKRSRSQSHWRKLYKQVKQ